MALPNPVTEWHTTSQQSAKTAAPQRGVVLHHGATTSADAIIDMETSGSRQVSSNRVVKDRRNAKIVDDNMRAWSLSSAYWDSVLRSVECANESTDGWTISAESHETLARQVAYWAQQDGFWPHREGDPKTWTVYGHREIYEIYGDSYATACPGGMDLNAVTYMAQVLLTGGDTTKDEENDMKQVFKVDPLPNGGAFVIFGPTSGPGDVALRVVKDQNLINQIMWPRGEGGGKENVGTVPAIPVAILNGVLKMEIGLDIGDGSILKDGFTFGPYSSGGAGGGYDDTELRKQIAALDKKVDAIPDAAANGAAARAAIVK